MHPKAQHVARTLDSFGVRTEVQELSNTTRTAQDAAAAIGTTVSQIAKSLVFLAGEQLVLVIASGANRVSPEVIGQRLDAQITQPDAKTVKKRTGYSAGGVPPVGHAEPAIVFLDRDLLSYDAVWAAAGTPHSLFSAPPDDLRRITGAEVVDVAG